MKNILSRFNPVYWLLVPLLMVSTWKLSHIITGTQASFLGFAENKQSDINSDQDMLVVRVHVALGDHVKKGDTLIYGFKPELDEEIRQADLSKDGLYARIDKEAEEVKAEISRLQNELEVRESALEAKIEQAREESGFYSGLTGSKADKNPEVASLEKELTSVRESYNRLMTRYRQLQKSPNPVQSQIRQADARKSYAEARKRGLVITAPFDGIIGNVAIREGENIKSFTPIVTMYEPTPPMVIGYISEKNTSGISVGDSVVITSLYHPDKTSSGIVMAIGHRIIEIPEKFRKVADVKTYGVEVYIRINSGNAFFQKEVLKIRPSHSL